MTRRRSPADEWLHPEGKNRALGNALPSRLTADGFGRLAEFVASKEAAKASQAPLDETEGFDREAALDEPEAEPTPVAAVIRRVASLNEIPSDMQSVGGGFYRQGHRIWELRGAEDSNGYVLVRKHEERAVDMMTPRPAVGKSASLRKTASTRKIHIAGAPLKPGDEVLFVRNGQVENAIVISIPQPGMANVQPSMGSPTMIPFSMIPEIGGLAPGVIDTSDCSCADSMDALDGPQMPEEVEGDQMSNQQEPQEAEMQERIMAASQPRVAHDSMAPGEGGVIDITEIIDHMPPKERNSLHPEGMANARECAELGDAEGAMLWLEWAMENSGSALRQRQNAPKKS